MGDPSTYRYWERSPRIPDRRYLAASDKKDKENKITENQCVIEQASFDGAMWIAGRALSKEGKKVLAPIMNGINTTWYM
jgi:nitrogenase molybdenum-iron protein alpha/beta subunit